jgi:hypothetical protein
MSGEDKGDRVNSSLPFAPPTPMGQLDNLVTTHMSEQLFQPNRLVMTLSSLCTLTGAEDPVQSVRKLAAKAFSAGHY